MARFAPMGSVQKGAAGSPPLTSVSLSDHRGPPGDAPIRHNRPEAAPDCLFCRVLAGDIKPALPVHVLIVPREHIVSADTLSTDHAEVLSEMMDTARKVARSEGLADRGYRLVFNVGEDAQNSVGHLHMHLVGGRPMGWPPG